MPEGLTLEEAKQALQAGAKFGNVYSELFNVANDGEALKHYFAHGLHLAKEDRPLREITGVPRDRVTNYTGDPCSNCGSFLMVRSGTCLTCQACGSTSGGCG